MELTITLDPSKESDIKAARDILDHLEERLTPASDDHIRVLVPRLLKGSDARAEYIRIVAEAGSDGISPRELIDRLGGDGRTVGGLRSSTERAWRAIGGHGWTEEFIETAENGNHVMPTILRTLVTVALNEAEEATDES